MDQKSAARIVEQLAQVTVERGATAPEAAVAAAKAEQIRAKYGIAALPPFSHRSPTDPHRRPRPAPAAGQTRWQGGLFGDLHVSDWRFDVKSGKGSSNVRVKHYQDASNWSIEIDL